jgi:hypothetical protein
MDAKKNLIDFSKKTKKKKTEARVFNQFFKKVK